MTLNRKEIINNFTIGFFPILIFLIADWLYGAMIGIIVALTIGFIELGYFYIKNKKIEKFILFDIGLLVMFGVVSLLLEDDFFFKLKPAVLELILVVVLAIHGFTNKPLLLLMGKRYLPNVSLQPFQEKLIRVMTQVMSVILFLHALLIVWSAQYASKEMWAFISGGLFYIIIALLFGGQWFYIKFYKNKMTPSAKPGEEWFDQVDQNGKVLGKAPRSHFHGNPKLIHPVVHVHVFNKQGRLFLQKRIETKELYPGFWDTAVGGHVSAGENIHNAMLREAQEELGLNAAKAQPIFRYVMRNNWESELIHTYKIVHNGPFKLCPVEISDGRFWTMFEIRKNLGKGIFTPNFEQEFAMLEKAGLV
ncbi:MAG: NUDIX domain-containing protein [Calditrichaeota bacterium]|nr:MAG: NUDIX domain-containing protein [Calditrichota bacterium]MBL1206191.1 NUDIX domain-containing protein [Calditrichota bacterium]NOG46015.1 NUDIX domain-containing protein [Calditrichota bacterium]